MEKITVGLIPAPELPEEIANKLTDTLCHTFKKMIDDDVDWKIEVVPDSITGAEGNIRDIIDRASTVKDNHDWTYAICLTDMPIFSNKDVVLASVNDTKGVAQVSIPAFGMFPMKTRVKKAIVQLINELYYRVNGESKVKDNGLVEKNNRKLLRNQSKLSPVRKYRPHDDENNIDMRYVLRPRFHGRMRVMSGMAYANRPWTIIPAFKSVMGIAFGTGAYGLIFTSMWNLSVAYKAPRFVLLMLCAVVSMIAWIMVAHNLWEKPAKGGHRRLRMLYNFTTVTTLSTAVMVYYGMLYLLFLIAVAAFVPPDLFASAVGLKPDELSIRHYFQLSWLVTSIATIAGAIGSGLEKEETVRKIMYGYRQQQRYVEMKKNEEAPEAENRC